MKTNVRVPIIILLCVAPFPAFGEKIDCSAFNPTSRAAAICVVSNENEKVTAELAALNARLLNIYKKPPADSSMEAELSEESATWARYRDTTCPLESRMRGGGAATETYCILEMNKQRVQQVKEWINL